MHTTVYPSPVDKLLTHGTLEAGKAVEWPDYAAIGIGPEHIPDLIRMATDKELMREEADDFEFAAPFYAMHILGELHAEAAIEPLLSLFEVDNEWIREDLAEVYSKIGPTAIPALTEYLLSPDRDEYAGAYAGDALAEIGKEYPETRLECINVLSRKLEQFEENPEELNAFLISDLMQLKAIEALPLIERAFAADCVDELVINMDDVLVGLGLKEREERPLTRLQHLLGGNSPSSEENSTSSLTLTPRESSWRTPQAPSKSRAGNKKAKNKMAKASRKKNRKK
jgi:hypothetical protein